MHILDNLDAIEAAVPGLKGRLHRSRIAVAGHSAGSWTVASLPGARNTDPRDGTTWCKPDPVGNGGADLSQRGRTLRLPF
jgi:predicted dienelactone hydrolase